MPAPDHGLFPALTVTVGITAFALTGNALSNPARPHRAGSFRQRVGPDRFGSKALEERGTK